jgi:protein TIF31
MNPNEPQRSHVYLHNCIFISRAVDAGVETFKMCQGDAAAKKTASRDAQCVAFLHRLDAPELYTLATVLLDYLGTRYVCQSVVPGILQGEKTHTLMYGTVEASAVMSWNKDMQDRLEQTIGKSAMCATRVQPAQALTDERLAEIAALRTEPPLEISPEQSKNVVKEPTTSVCGPIEGKGIKGSDKRNYVLDLTRLTPRDANWIPKTKGGTGKWEEVYSKNEFIPESLDDPEWVASVLRHELVKSLTQHKMTVYLKTKEVAGDQDKNGNSPDKAENETRSEKAEGEEIAGEDVEPRDDNKDGDLAEKLPKKKSLAPEDEEFLESLRLNVNVFLPNLRSLKGLDDNSVARLEKDEEEAREVAIHLWDVVLPKMTQEMREGEGHQLPLDGKSMVELLHQRGINLRYMGRLATLAVKEEAKDSKAWADIQAGNINSISRRVLPLSWLELLETEMVARAAKHVLDRYLSEEGSQIFQVIASFLSALVSEGEETAGDTEKRLAKMTKDDGFPDDEELADFSLVGNVPIRGRKDVWDDIEKEIGRRFRYKVHLYNCSKPSGRASYATLLRRLCQRTGVRLAAKKYSLGGKCLCASEGSLINSFPISPLDIVDVVPLMKHAGALAGEGFVPCIGGASIPSLHILFPDAKATFETAHLHFSARNLPHALEYAQEATALYQRVVDGPLHLNVSRCLDLTAAILFEAGENALAAAHASRSLGLAIQLGGFDAAETMAGHSTLSHILLSSQQIQSGVQHLMAVAYLMELLAGPRYVELSNCLYKIGSFYQMTNPELALQYFKMAQACPHPDRLAEGMMSKGAAMLYAKIEQYRSAVDSEKKTYQLYSMLLGEGHELTLNSQKALQTYTKLAVEQGNRKIEQEKLRKEEEAADAIASLIEAEEEEERKKRKSKGKGKKK